MRLEVQYFINFEISERKMFLSDCCSKISQKFRTKLVPEVLSFALSALYLIGTVNIDDTMCVLDRLRLNDDTNIMAHVFLYSHLVVKDKDIFRVFT